MWVTVNNDDDTLRTRTHILSIYLPSHINIISVVEWLLSCLFRLSVCLPLFSLACAVGQEVAFKADGSLRLSRSVSPTHSANDDVAVLTEIAAETEGAATFCLSLSTPLNSFCYYYCF